MRIRRLDMYSDCDKKRKLSELASIIRGVSYPGISFAGEKKTKTKCSSMDVKAAKHRELGKLVRGI
jgi:hypothetical protein